LIAGTQGRQKQHVIVAHVTELEIEEQVGSRIAIDVADPQELTAIPTVPLERSNLLALAPVTNPECVILKDDIVAVFTNGIAESVEIKPWTLSSPSDPRAYVDCFARVDETSAVDR
jgi:hypothetical protein